MRDSPESVPAVRVRAPSTKIAGRLKRETRLPFLLLFGARKTGAELLRIVNTPSIFRGWKS